MVIDEQVAHAVVVALRAYVKAQGRMLDRWAEGDVNVRRDLWRGLHACEDAGRAALEAVDRFVDAKADEALNMSDEEIRAEYAREGLDPDQVAAETRAIFERTIAERDDRH